MASPESLSDCLGEVARWRKMRLGATQDHERFALQKSVVEFIQNTIDEGQKRIILIQAPTGFGKSWIALALARRDKTSILTSTVDLQEQYKNEFPFLPVVKGKKRFPCKQYYEEKTCEDGFCEKCEFDVYTPRTMEDGTASEKEQLSARVKPGTAGTFDEQIIHGNHGENLGNGTGIQCYYYAALKAGSLAASAVYSYSSFLVPLKNASIESQTREYDANKIPDRTFLVCDEAHDYDKWISDLDAVELDKKLNEELLGKNPQINPYDSQQDKTHQVHDFVKELITKFQDIKPQYEKCLSHTLYLGCEEHLKQHPELECKRGHGDGFTIKPRCRDTKKSKGCTKLRAFIKEGEYLRCDKTCDQKKIENCGEDHSQFNHEKYQKLSSYNSKLLGLYKLLDKQENFDDDQLESEGLIVRKVDPVMLGPVHAVGLTNLLLNKHQITVFLSSTLNKEDFCKEIGVISSSARTLTEGQEKRMNDLVAYYDVPNLIPVQNRRVWLLDLLKMSSDEKLYQDGTVHGISPLAHDKSWKIIIMPAIKALLVKHSKQRGIIMVTTYEQLKKIRDLQDDYLRNRLTFDVDDKNEQREFKETKKKHLAQHCHDYLGGKTVPDFLCKDEDCKRTDKIYNSVIVTLKGLGINLEYDESRFQIILKAPYVPEMIRRKDERADFIRKNDPDRFSRKSAFKLVQFCGRSVRHNDDEAITYVLDRACSTLYRKNKEYLPIWFKPRRIYDKKLALGFDLVDENSPEYRDYDDNAYN
jgi:Rad3-related DNA helicase